MGEVEEFLSDWEDFEPEFVPGVGNAAPRFLEVPKLFGPGVYALLRNGEVCYIGKALCLIQRVYAHWNMMCRIKSGKPVPKTGAKALIFNGLKVMPCDASDLSRLEKEMIARYRPKLNTKLVPKGRSTLEQVGFDFTRIGVTQVVATPRFERRF